MDRQIHCDINKWNEYVSFCPYMKRICIYAIQNNHSAQTKICQAIIHYAQTIYLIFHLRILKHSVHETQHTVQYSYHIKGVLLQTLHINKATQTTDMQKFEGVCWAEIYLRRLLKNMLQFTYHESCLYYIGRYSIQISCIYTYHLRHYSHLHLVLPKSVLPLFQSETWHKLKD